MKEKEKKLPWIFRVWYYFLIIIVGHGSVFWYMFRLDHEAGGALPGHYTTAERYFNWCSYLNRRASGERCTYEEVEDEFMEEWRKNFQEAVNEFNRIREKEDTI